MRSIVSVVAIMALTCLVCGAAATSYPAGFRKAPTFVLDLSQPPETRWAGAVDLVIEANGWADSFGNLFDFYLPQLNVIPAVACDIMYANFMSQFPERAAELDALTKQIVKAAKSHGTDLANFTTARAVMFTYFYEFGDLSFGSAAGVRQRDRACTGILSLPSDRTQPMIHGRNMDESPRDGRNITLDITVMRNNKYLYNIFDWTWFTAGSFTASKTGFMTLEENWRMHSYLTFEQIFERILTKGTMPISLLFRHIAESNMTFDESVEFLNTTQVAAPFYVITSGPNRVGAVVTGSFNATDNVVEFLTDNSTSTFMVQTNYDRWLPDPMSDPRRTVAEEHMSLIGRERSGTQLGVWMAISTFPVHNPGTMYTALMQVDKAPEGYIRVPMLPSSKYRP